MKVLISGFNPTGILLGSLLALRGHEVIFAGNQGSGESNHSLRLVLPDRWLLINNLKSGWHSPAELIIICDNHLQQATDNPTSRINNLSTARDENTLILVCHNTELPAAFRQDRLTSTFLPLLNAAMLQPDQVELFSGTPVILLEKKQAFRKLGTALRQCGIHVYFVDAIEAFFNAVLLFRLLHLPVALCNTGLNHFLSFSEGRKIAEHLLLEGIQVLQQQGRKLARLPVMDPLKLLKRICKNPGSFAIYRYLPDREINPVLQSLILKEQERFAVNLALLQLAGEAGIDVFWNAGMVKLFAKTTDWAFFHSPVELIKAVE